MLGGLNIFWVAFPSLVIKVWLALSNPLVLVAGSIQFGEVTSLNLCGLDIVFILPSAFRVSPTNTCSSGLFPSSIPAVPRRRCKRAQSTSVFLGRQWRGSLGQLTSWAWRFPCNKFVVDDEEFGLAIC